MIRRIVFIDSRVAYSAAFMSGLPANTECFVIGPTEGGIVRMQAVLQHYSGLDAIHIVSHGSSGSLLLGSTQLDTASLPLYGSALLSMGQSLSEGGDILLYGCNIADGQVGLQFLQSLAQHTQADVAASSDATGPQVLGGNAMLEVATGSIETAPLLLDGLNDLLVTEIPALTSKYFVLPGAGANHVDYQLKASPLSLQGQYISQAGTTGVDSIHVRAGSAIDFTASGASADKVYLDGAYGDYGVSLTGTLMTLYRGSGASYELVRVGRGVSLVGSDILVFADGSVSTWDLFNLLKSGTPLPVLGSETSLQPLGAAAPGSTLSATIKAFALDSGGETFASVGQGMQLITAGSIGVDTVYVGDGSTVDATLLGASSDLIYLRGDWGDYSKSVAGSVLTFSRLVNGQTESVKVIGGNGALNDKLIFADGAVLSNNAKLALNVNLNAAIDTVTGYDPHTTTPGLRPQLQASALDNVSNLDVSSNIVLSYSESVTAQAGKYIRIVDDGGAGFRGESSNHTQLIAVTDSTQVSIVGGKVTLNPTFDLDLASNYHIEIDAGAFVGQTSGQATGAYNGSSGLNFSTVTPGTGTLVNAASSQAMDASGAMVAGYNWLDIEGMGSPSASSGTPVDLSGGNFALVAKDYDASGGNSALDYDGIQLGDLYVAANNFALGDLIYIDDQFNNLSAQNDLSLTAVLDQGTPPTKIQFAGTGLGGFIDVTLFGSTATFDSVAAFSLAVGGTAVYNPRITTPDTTAGLPLINLSSVAAGVGGFVINGQCAGDYSGYSVSSAGDVNGDGLADLIVGAYFSVPSAGLSAGRSYVVFGKTDTAEVNLSAVAAGSGGFVINGQCAGDWSGLSVSLAGDFNGDGLADLIVGGPSSSAGAGRSYVVFGKTDTADVNLSAIASGSGGFVINGQCANDNSGSSVSSVGDVNGDGLFDLIVGAYSSDPSAGSSAGRSYVVFGKTDTGGVNLSTIAAGSGGFVINGQCAGDLSGINISSAGDVNGDGLADLIVGASGSDPSAGIYAGRSYVVFGKTDTTEVNLSFIAAGSGGFVINGQCANDISGNSVSSAGDVNGDGLADLIVGASESDPSAGPDAGRSYVVFGKTDAGAVNLSAIAAGSGGFVINGQCAGDFSGACVSLAGDVNGDGLADLIVGAYNGDPSAVEGAGRSYVVFGKTDTVEVNLAAIAAGTDGFVINGQCAFDASGYSVSSAGDVNGDGLADLFVGVVNSDPSAGSNAGRSYVIFGSTNGAFNQTAVNWVGTSGNDTQSDDGVSKTLVAGMGNDTLTANAASVLYGGAGNDTFNIDSNMIAALQSPMGSGGNITRLSRIDGGTGLDTITLSGSGLTFDLTQVASQAASDPETGSRIASIETIDITGSGNNTLKLNLFDVLDLGSANTFEATGRQQLMVKGNAGDQVDLADRSSWTLGTTVSLNGTSYVAWNHSTSMATLYLGVDLSLVETQVHFAPFELSNIAAGSSGFIMYGTYDGEATGSSVSSAGDVNGDGLADLIVGAWSGSLIGRSYVVFGKTDMAALNLLAIGMGSGGFVINGHCMDDRNGWSVSSAGDVNGDGLADLIVGAPLSVLSARSSVIGRSYVVFGKTDATSVNLAAIAEDLGGFVINGQCVGDMSGYSVSSAGDVNGDGLADLIVGANGSSPSAGTYSGRSYVVFGKTDTVEVNLSSIAASSGGFVINGQCTGDWSGVSVSSAGDVNGDGLADLIVGANGSSPSAGTYAGRTYVVFGKTDTVEVNLSAIASGSGGFVINGQCANENSGSSVSSAGDVNGDGLADLIVGAHRSDPSSGTDAGRSYVVFGKTDTGGVNLSTIAVGSGGFVINGQCVDDLSGISTSSAGDVNGDGLADLIVGAFFSDPSAGTDAGRSYVVFGKTDAGAVNLSAIEAGLGGFVINGQCANDYSGQSVSLAGDVNGDGLTDLIVGATGGDPSTGINAGRSYVIFGSTSGAFNQTAVDWLGTSVDDTQSDGGVAKTLVAGMGNDTLTANAASVLYGGEGNDTFNIDSNMIAALQSPMGSGGNITRLSRIDGGTGLDTISLSGSGLTFDLTQVASQAASDPETGSRIASIETIDITGSGNNTLKLNLFDVLDLGSANIFAATGRQQLMVKGNAGDQVDLVDRSAWTLGTTVSLNGTSYVAWNHNTSMATLYLGVDLSLAAVPYAPIELSAIAAGSGGFVINGQCASDLSGRAVSSAGDVNGDGLADLIVGASNSSGTGTSTGSSYLVFGKADSVAVNLSAVASGSGGFVINGEYFFDASGYSVSSGGDVNGDGLADLIVGAPGSASIIGINAGRSYVVFGKTDSAAVNLTAIVAGSSGFVINGQCEGNHSGYSVSSAGDVNADGLADLIVGAVNSMRTGTLAGSSYLVFGKTESSAVDLSTVASGSGGFVVDAHCAFDNSGYSVSSAGDVNGDGMADLILGATGSDPSAGTDAGRSYVVFGKSTAEAINLSLIGSGSGGFVINGQCALDYSGSSVSSAGDVNGDGLADLIVGAPVGNPSTGYSYVVFGKTNMTEVNLSAIAAGLGGFVINGQCAYDISGFSVSSSGDVNGDGLNDLIVGAPGSAPSVGANAGRSYVVYGKTDAIEVYLSAIAAGLGGFVINGQCEGDSSGNSVSSAGDVNGDGLADLIVGAPNSGPSTGAYAGRSYVIFGSTNGAFNKTSVDWLGASGNDAQSDGGVSKTLVAGMGNDTLTATAASVLYGGAGNDTFNIDSNMIAALQSPMGSGGNLTRLSRIDGGTGLDIITLSGSGLTFDLTQVASQAASDPETDSRIASIETIDITGSGNNTLKLNLFDVLDLGSANTFEATGRQQLMVKGNAGDQVELADRSAWTLGTTVSLNGTSYVAWNHSTSMATLYLTVDVSLVETQVPYAAIELSAIVAGAGGFVINGQGADDRIGSSVSSAGDVNGDGLADLIMGAFGGDPSAGQNAGRSYVVFGKTGVADVNLSAIAAGSGGFVINGQCAGDLSGLSVSSAGDVNGDGLADLIVGAINTDDLRTGKYAGRSYVVFGKTDAAEVNLSAIAVGSRGFVINGQCAGDNSGRGVSTAGDVNGDGLADLIVGAWLSDPGADKNDAGRSYVVFGKTATAEVNLSAIAAGSGGFVVNGQCADDRSGFSVSSGGDINGDGLADLIVGAYLSDPIAATDAGRSYVVFGKTDAAQVNLSAIAAGSGGFVINGQCAGDWSGLSVSLAGDVNGDGLADLIVGAPSSSAGGERSYVVFGKTDAAEVNLSTIAAGSGGFVINGQCVGDRSGYSVSSASDVNGDGLADLIVGAFGSSPSAGAYAGRSYVVFGKTDAAEVSLSAIAAGSGGFVINGQCANDNSGISVSSAGDVNGDGLADLIVGAYASDPSSGTDAGRSYVIFGSTSGAFNQTAVDWLGTLGNDTQSDGGVAKTLVAGMGNDTLTATAASVLYGGAGNDIFNIDSAMITALQSPMGSGGNVAKLSRIDGGTGLDTIELTGSRLTFDLTQVASQAASDPETGSRIASIETIDITGSGNNTLKLNLFDVLDLGSANTYAATGRQQLMVKGNAGDQVDLADSAGTSGWTQGNAVTLESVTYQVWNHNTALATLYVQNNGVLVV